MGDPLKFSKDKPAYTVDRYRDAEIVHGRMSMLAIAGMLLAEVYHPLFPKATGTAYEQMLKVGEVTGPMFLFGWAIHMHMQEAQRFYLRYKTWTKWLRAKSLALTSGILLTLLLRTRRTRSLDRTKNSTTAALLCSLLSVCSLRKVSPASLSCLSS